MLDVKKTLAKLLNNQIKTKTLTATTTATGAVELPVDVRSGFLTAWTTNMISICTRRDGGYLMVRDAQTFGAIANRQVSITIKYIVGGVLLNSIFKAFSHLQKIGGGLNAGHKETDCKSCAEVCRHRNGLLGCVDTIKRLGGFPTPYRVDNAASGDVRRNDHYTNSISGLAYVHRFRASVLRPVLSTGGNANIAHNKHHDYMGDIRSKHIRDVLVLRPRLVESGPYRINTSERGWAAC